MPHMSTKIDNTWTKMVTWHPSTPEYGSFRPINITTAPTPASIPRAALNYNIWQFMVPTLNQRLGSFRTELRADIFPLCRQNHPHPPPINSDGFHGLSMKKIWSKKLQKTSHSPVSNFLVFPVSLLQLSLLSLSLLPRQLPTASPSLFRHQFHHASPKPLVGVHHVWNSHCFFLLLISATSFFFLLWLTSAIVPHSNTAQTINLTSWSWLRLLLRVSRSSINLHFLQPF